MAALAFTGQLKANPNVGETCPITIAVGTGVIAILLGWYMLACRWWSYAQAELYRMREIEQELGMYLIQEGTWLREGFETAETQRLTDEGREVLARLRASGLKVSGVQQRVLSLILVLTLVVIWFLFILADCFGIA
jgi:hypothetical protein